MDKLLNIKQLMGGGKISLLTLLLILTYSCSEPPAQELAPTRAPVDSASAVMTISVTIRKDWAGETFLDF